MDTQAICAADDETLREMGIDTRGDIVAVKVFCKRRLSTNKAETQKEEREKKKQQLLSLLTSGRSHGGGPNRKVSKKSEDKKKATEDNKKKRLELGWLHQFNEGDQYANVRAKDGGGMRIVALPGNSRKSDIIAYAKKLFFPNGASPIAREDDLVFQLGNYRQEKVQPTVTFPDGTVHPFTLNNYTKSTKLSKTRLYIITRKMDDSDSDSGVNIAMLIS